MIINPDKKLFSYAEIYGITVKALRSMPILMKAKKSGILSSKLQERIMLAVTGVNQCPMCSYAHTDKALQAGLRLEEIKAFVEGEIPGVPDAEIKAILFAQHYADRRGKPSTDSWNSIVLEYGEERAKAILSATRIIMMGNALGIPAGSLGNRIKRKATDPRSSLAYEIGFVLLLLPIILVSLLHALVAFVANYPFAKFD